MRGSSEMLRRKWEWEYQPRGCVDSYSICGSCPTLPIIACTLERPDRVLRAVQGGMLIHRTLHCRGRSSAQAHMGR